MGFYALETKGNLSSEYNKEVIILEQRHAGILADKFRIKDNKIKKNLIFRYEYL